MQTLVLFSILSASLFYLGSRATITGWLWSRYPPGFARFADCPACTGFWNGALLSLIFGDLFDPVFTRGIVEPYSIALEAVLVGLCMIVLTPIVAGIMQYALGVVGHAVEPDSTVSPSE